MEHKSAAQQLVQRYNWMRSNFCEGHGEMAEMSTGPCPWCRLEEAKQRAWTVVNAYDSTHSLLGRNIEDLREWLENDDS